MLRWSVVRRYASVLAVALVSAFMVVGCDGCGSNPAAPPGEPSNDPSFVDVPTQGKSLDKLLEDGHASLADGKYDEAIAYYEAAYNKDNNNAKAITYSVLARLAGISVDPKVVDLFKNRIGFKDYPNRFNALLSGKWLTTYPEVDVVWYYYDANGDQVRYFDKWDVDYGWYEGVVKPGYYKEECEYSYDDDFYFCNHTLVSAGEPRKEKSFESSYYDEKTNRWVSWLDERAIQDDWYTGVTKAGYHTCVYNYDGQTCTFVSDTKRYYESTLPGLNTPSWVKGNNSVYNGSLFNGASTVETWPILMFANLLDKNTNGLNSLIDETIVAVFGTSFNAACERTKKLKGKESSTLDKKFLEVIYLEEIIDEYDPVGWAELNAIVSFMTAIKASLEWVAAYDWNTNLSFLKYSWSDEADFYSRLRNVNANDLPFNNNFLKARSGKMEVSKASFIKAVKGLQASYTEISNSGNYPSVVKSAYPALNDGAQKLVSAIENGGVFYIPKSDPTKIKSWPTSGNGIDMGKLFQSGYFSLQYLFETDNGKPVFYADGVKLTTGNYAQMINNAGYAGIRFKTKRVTDIFVTNENINNDEPLIDFSDKYAKLLFEKFNNLPLSQPAPAKRLAKRSELPESLAKSSSGR